MVTQPTILAAPSPAPVVVSQDVSPSSTFDGRGNDFLSPGAIGDTIGKIATGIQPAPSDSFTGQLTPPGMFTNSSDANTVLLGTSSELGSILSPDFGQNLVFKVSVLPGASIQPIPDLGTNPDPTKVLVSSTFFANNVTPPAAIINASNLNPLIWKNPNASSILLGSLQAQSNILGAAGLMFPPLTPAASQQPISPFGSAAPLLPQGAPTNTPSPTIPQQISPVRGFYWSGSGFSPLPASSSPSSAAIPFTVLSSSSSLLPAFSSPPPSSSALPSTALSSSSPLPSPLQLMNLIRLWSVLLSSNPFLHQLALTRQPVQSANAAPDPVPKPQGQA